jgi:hypothetical protein
MRQHIAIRKEGYVAGSAKEPEVKVFTQTHAARPPVPWDRLSAGDIVWMKWSGGPIVGRGIVEGFRQIEHCTAEILRNTVLGTRLHRLDDYWNSRPPVFHGMAIYLGSEEWVDSLIFPAARSYGNSWIVLDSPEKEAAWLTDVGEGAAARSGAATRSGRSRSIAPSRRFQVLRRDGFTCTYCGRQPPEVSLQVDHVIPWSKGGTHDLANLRTACMECNLGKSDTLLE